MSEIEGYIKKIDIENVELWYELANIEPFGDEYKDQRETMDKIRNTGKILREVRILCENGLINDEGHHKQWYLEQIITKLGFNLNKVLTQIIIDGYDCEKGIPP